MTKYLTPTKWLCLIVIVAFGLRLYRINNPVADWHSFRQADTASVTREYVKNGVDLLRPEYQDLSNIQSGKDNLEGYRMVEFPIINALTAWLVSATGAPLVLTSRLVSVFFSLATLLSLYGLVTALSGRRLGLVTAAIFAVLPYNLFYSHAILPEPALLFFSTFSLFAFQRWLKNKNLFCYAASLLSLALALLLKPFALFLGPVYLMLVWQTYGLQFWKQWLLLPYVGLALAPLIWWREWIKQFPSGIPASDWLFNSNGIRLRPAWFRWLFWERLTVLIGGYVGSLLLVANIFNTHKDRWVYASWWAGMLVYFVIIATGNVQHDYYQAIVIPIFCISVARGILTIYDFLATKLKPWWSTTICILLLGVMLTLAWRQVAGFFNVNHWEYVEAGQAVDELLPADAKVIAPAFGDTHFLFQTNRRGWPIGFEIEDKINKGATHYVTTSDDDEARRLSEEYLVLKKTPKYIIIDLQNKK